MRKHLITFVLLLSYTIAFAQPKANSKVADDLLIKKLLHQLNLQRVTDGLTTQQLQNKKIVNKLLTEDRGGYRNGHVTYSSDNKFKIFVFEGEDIGGHASPIYASFISVNGKLTHAANDRYFPIKNIHKLSDKSYLIMHGGMTGGGNRTDDQLLATLLTIENGKVSYPETSYGKSSLASESSTIVVYQPQMLFEDQDRSKALTLKYDPNSKILSYSYYQDNGDDKIHQYQGSFKYINNRFVFQNETKKLIK